MTPNVRVSTCGLLFVLLVAGCGGSSLPAGPRRLAFFGVDARQARAETKVIRRLEELVPRLVDEMQTFRIVPPDEIKEQLRGKKGKLRPCHEPQCQVKAGRGVAATAALALRIEKNLVQECDVYASLFMLRKSGADQRSRARAGCTAQELLDSVRRAACRVLVTEEGGSAEEQTSRHAGCLAAAELLALEQEVELFGSAVNGSPETLVKEERRLAEKALALRSRFAALQRSAPAPVWSIAAECRTGTVYEAFARSLAEGAIEVPKPIAKQGEAAAASFRAGMKRTLDEKARPLQKQAAEIYRACLKRAETLKVGNKYTEQTRHRLAAIDRR